MDADGCLRITGRIQDLFKTSKGKYIAPAPIENRLMLLMTPWTVDNHMITSTFKVRRNSIETQFAARYSGWVGMKTKVIWGD